MDSSFRFAYVKILYVLVPLIAAAVWYRLRYYKAPMYSYPLADTILRKHGVSVQWRQRFFMISRFCMLVALAFLISRPQVVDKQSKVLVEGIDIMLVLDVSGSMQLFDDEYDQKQRIAIAKEEAIKFIKKRENDPIGLVLFGNEAVSRCPLTLDKSVLESIVNDIELGVIDSDGTVISKAIITALNRLKKSEAKTKIIILLTDGEPSQGDLHPSDALTLAQKYGVKIYTIGIGSPEGGIMSHPLLGLQRTSSVVNTELLELLARRSGGKCFLAHNQKELQKIYETINALEQSEYETDVYHKYHDIFMPFLWILAGWMVLEGLLATFVWFSL